MRSICPAGLACSFFLAGCVGADAQPKALDRATQAPLILGEVLRYEIQRFAANAGEAEGVLCVAVRDGQAARDPSPDIMQSIGGLRAQPQSRCQGNETLIAGPIEWVRDDEVHVKGGHIRGSEGERLLAYRVVLEAGQWKCVGPIVSWDPL